MSDSIKISVIIAVYNSGSTLEDCLISIFDQVYKNFELIIIDNNSNDNTDCIINKYRDRIDHFIKEKDKGIYDAWNKGLNLSTGEWISFIGADDYLLPYTFNSLVNGINLRPDCNFISGKIKLLRANGYLIVGKPFSHRKLLYFQNFVHIGSLTSKKLFDDCLFDTKYQISGDYDFFVRNRRKIIPSFVDLILAESELGISQRSSKVFSENYDIWLCHNLHSKIFCFILYNYQLLVFRVKNILGN